MDQQTYEAARDFTGIGDSYQDAPDDERAKLLPLLLTKGAALHALLSTGNPEAKRALSELLALLSIPQTRYGERATEAYVKLGIELIAALKPQGVAPPAAVAGKGKRGPKPKIDRDAQWLADVESGVKTQADIARENFVDESTVCKAIERAKKARENMN